MKIKLIILLSIFTITLFPTNVFTQTQAEIEQMLNGDIDETKKKQKKVKKEKPVKLNKKEKQLKEKEKLAKKEQKEIEKKENLVIDQKNEKNTKEPKIKILVKETENAVDDTKKLATVDPTDKMNYNKLRKTANKLGEKGSYFNALSFYEKALFKAKNDKKKVQMYEQIANSNFFLRDYKAAETNYQKALALNTKPKKYPLLQFQLANTYKALAKYDSSVVEYKAFIEREQENKKLIWAVRKAKKELKGSNFALVYENTDPKFRIKNAGDNVNGPFTEYGPEIVDNRLYFSKINSEKVVVLDDEIKEKEFSKIYYAEIVDDSLALFQDFAENINASKEHVGNPSFTKDGNTVYFTKCSLTSEMQSECRLFVSNRENNVWSKAKILNSNINLENTSNSQPQIIDVAEGQKLYFVSNREGGKGGKDIWYVNIDEDGSFSKVKNIGYPVNTAFDEVSPHYNQNSQSLYFSSNGHTSFGGLDVFKVTKNEEDEWNEVIENLGYPVNSSLDDYDFVLDDSETAGYLASNRIGTTSLKSETCCDDIFAVNPTKVDLFVTGKVFVENETNRSILESADLYLYDKKTNERVEEIEYRDGKAYVSQVLPEMDYKIVAMADGFKDTEISFNTEGLKKSDTLEYNLFMKNKDLTGHILSTVYYEFDVSKLRSDAPDSLRKVVTFMEAYPDVIIEVGSHTDSKGSEKYNLALSERRSLSVKNYLIYQQKISEKRLVNKWYGESKPAAPNTLKNGKDNPEGRDLNRRTEFKVIGYLKK